MIESNIEQATKDPGKDYHLQADIEQLVARSRDDPEEFGRRVDEIDSANRVSSPLVSYLVHLRNWEQSNHSDYQSGIGPALADLQDAFDEALANGWFNIAAFCVRESIARREELSGHSVDIEVSKALDFLAQNEHETSLQVHNAYLVCSLVLSHGDHLSMDERHTVIDLAHSICDELQRTSRYEAARELLASAFARSRSVDYRYEDTQERFAELVEHVASLRDETEYRARFLEHVLSEYRELVPEENANEWRGKIRTLNRQVRTQNTSLWGIDYDQLQVEVRRLLAAFNECTTSEPYPTAFAALLLSNIGIVDGDTSTDVYATDPTRIVSPEGDTIALEERADELGTIPDEAYLRGTHLSNLILFQFVEQLFERRLVTEGDLYRLVHSLPGADANDRAYLTDIVINYFEGRYPEMIHLGLPRFESLVVNAFQEYEVIPTKTTSDGTFEQQTLGGLLTRIEREVDESLGRYLRFRYTEKSGMNIRNRVSHGQTAYQMCSKPNATVLLFDLLRTPVRIGNHYRNEAGS